MNRLFAAGLVLGLTLVMTGAVSAKAPTAKMIITGVRLASPLEVTAADVVKQFNPWGSEFREGARGAEKADAPARRSQPYEVQFYVNLSDDETRLMYVIYYSPSPAQQRGYIYLPMRGEQWYWHNAQTMLTTTGWFQASREWDALIKPIIEAAEAPRKSQ